MVSLSVQNPPAAGVGRAMPGVWVSAEASRAKLQSSLFKWAGRHKNNPQQTNSWIQSPQIGAGFQENWIVFWQNASKFKNRNCWLIIGQLMKISQSSLCHLWHQKDRWAAAQLAPAVDSSKDRPSGACTTASIPHWIGKHASCPQSSRLSPMGFACQRFHQSKRPSSELSWLGKLLGHCSRWIGSYHIRCSHCQTTPTN